jgi:dynein heavy chain
MPSENKKFKNIDKIWRKIIEETQADPTCLTACSREGLLEKFTEAEATLEKVKSGLMAYLESKRAVFARFYFLANEDLLEILS